ncbi:MAG: DNA methylase [Methanomassiliicoccales archaeon]|nr:MAG: DNA methylase [Methanomassiliicoccales archaeon]
MQEIGKDVLGKLKTSLKKEDRAPEETKIERIQPEDFKLEHTTVWNFQKRGDWATHKGDFRGNWAPQIPRNLLLRYSKVGDTVLDPMVGSGTTLIEAKVTGRNGIGLDVDPSALLVSLSRLDFDVSDDDIPESSQKVFIGDARNMDLVENESIDLGLIHPPQPDYIGNVNGRNSADLSFVSSFDEYCKEMKEVAKEMFRTIKPGKYCSILIGDTRRHKHYVPISHRIMQNFLDVGFTLKENVIKRQWNCSQSGFWARRSKRDNFLLISHKNLFVFRKPDPEEDIAKLENSMKWW